MLNHIDYEYSLHGTEEIFIAAVDNMPECFGIYTAIKNEFDEIEDFLIEYVNFEACKHTYLKKEEQVGKMLLGNYPITWDYGLFNEFCKVIETGEPLIKYITSYYDKTKDQQLYKVYDFRAVKVRNSVAVTWNDITENSNIEKTLRESELHFSRAFENASIGLSITSIDGNLLKVNHALCDMLGYSESELINMSFLELTYPEDLNGNLHYFKDALEGKINSYHMEKRYVHKDGHLIWILLNASLIRGSDGNPLYFTSQYQDITKIKQANETLEYDRLKTDFFANISHELRTPINIILNSIQLIEFRVKNEQLTGDLIHKYNKTMRQNCLRLIRLINNLIDATKIDAGFYTIHLQNHDIVSLIKQITFSVSDYVKSKSIALNFDSELNSKVIACDPDKIERIMLNLLSNAIKFSKVNGKLQVQILDKGSQILIIVRDNGIGIPDENCKKIFERFRQIDKSLKRNHEGSGIGLSLVKSFVEMHEGTIKVNSIYGEGSEFIISLPVKVLDKANISMEDTSTDYRNGNIEKIHIEFSDIYFEA
jgi:PAS domain S-box-containing protein